MKAKEFAEACRMAKAHEYKQGDGDVLIGCGLPEFKPVACTLAAAAEHIAWQCINLDGTINNEALDETWKIARYKWLIMA
jgi:hypothetical protein